MSDFGHHELPFPTSCHALKTTSGRPPTPAGGSEALALQILRERRRVSEIVLRGAMRK
jgi:hypothetical protein